MILGGALTTMAGCTGCPTALLSGQLAEQGDELVVRNSGVGRAEHVIWPFGYGVHAQAGQLILTDLFGSEKARAGDTVRLGGGETESGTFKVCGQLEVDRA